MCKIKYCILTQNILDHFADIGKMVDIGSGAEKYCKESLK